MCKRSAYLVSEKIVKETDIGRHVNRLRKHPSNEVRGLVKHLVRYEFAVIHFLG